MEPALEDAVLTHVFNEAGPSEAIAVAVDDSDALSRDDAPVFGVVVTEAQSDRVDEAVAVIDPEGVHE
jgi:hypothetical protein